MGIASIVQSRLDREDMAWTCKVLVVLILAITMAETSSLPQIRNKVDIGGFGFI